MKNKIIKILKHKELQLQEVWNLQKIETKKLKLNDLDKNEIEIKAQISILRHLLSERASFKKIVQNLFKINNNNNNNSHVISKTLCTCDDGKIPCPGCSNDNSNHKCSCAGCHGKGIVTCGKCGGK
jgi:hypothetical protein